MTTYKIIACDMDETLLSSDASICQRNIDVIQQAIRQGVKFVPCTGRGFRSVEGVLKILGLCNKKNSMSSGLTVPALQKTKDILLYLGIPSPLT